jgi:circadian clock protein KaiB
MTSRTKFKFCLYVTGEARNSVRAISNLSGICAEYLPGRHTIQVVDVLKEPTSALADGIFMTPTLIRLAPGPAVRIVGTLSDAKTVLQALGLEAHLSVA